MNAPQLSQKLLKEAELTRQELRRQPSVTLEEARKTIPAWVRDQYRILPQFAPRRADRTFRPEKAAQ